MIKHREKQFFFLMFDPLCYQIHKFLMNKMQALLNPLNTLELFIKYRRKANPKIESNSH